MSSELSENNNTSQPFVFWLVIFYMFLAYTHATDVYPSLGNINFQRMVMLVLLFSVFVTKNKSQKKSAINVIIVLYLLVLYLASALSPMSEIAFTATNDYLKFIVFYFVIITVINTEEQFKLLVVWFFLISFLYVMMTLREFYFFGQNIYDMGVVRLTGWDPSTGPNGFALKAAYSLPFGAIVLKKGFFTELRIFKYKILTEKYFRLIVAVVYFPLTVLAIFLTNSRSGLVALAVFVLFMLFKSKHKFKILILLVAIAPLTYQAIPDESKARYGTLLGFVGIDEKPSFEKSKVEKWSTASAEGRLVGLERGMEIFMEKPMFGVGPGVFAFVSGTREQTHNLLAQLAAEAGIFALILFALLIFMIYKRYRRMQKNESSVYSNIASASIQTLVLLLFASIVAHTMLEFIWLFMAAISVLGTHFMEQQERKKEQSVL